MEHPLKPSRSTVTFGIVAGGFILFIAWGERRRPLRVRVESQMDRTARNLALAGTSLLISQSAEAAVTPSLFRMAERHNLGLLRVLPLPQWLRQPLSFLLLDYSLYGWHWLNHQIPWLWRGHLVHHIDLDMDASTGIRFHFWELLMTLSLRFVQILVLGTDQKSFLFWNRTLLLAVIFQHSNLRLPPTLDRLIAKVLVTPQVHAVHHSQDLKESESNFSSMLIIWDKIHHTHRATSLRLEPTMGVPTFPEPVPLNDCLALPFQENADRFQPQADQIQERSKSNQHPISLL
jgi:sterol desaturase/sphingolipid hydroxylase (fatty acid hydroxylase superfamily)